MESAHAPRLTEIEAILFDFDGTLVRQTIDFQRMRQRAREVAAAYGVDVGRYGEPYVLEFLERVFADLLKADEEQAHRFRREAEEAIVAVELEAAKEAAAIPGVPQLLQKLRAAGISVGIVTRNCRRSVEEVLRRTPLPCDVLLTRDDVRRVKPDPEHLRLALRALGAAPERSLMVGDHPMDVQAGHAIGAWTIGILNDDRPPDYFAAVQPHAVLRSVLEIPAYLGMQIQ